MKKDWWIERGFKNREEACAFRTKEYRKKTQKICKCGKRFHGNRKYCSNKCNIMNNIKIKKNGCWIWQGSTASNGYGTVCDLSTRTQKKGSRLKHVPVHRLSYETFVGEIPEGLLACHNCDVPSCCNPQHIFLGTYKDNAQDAQKKKRLFPVYIGRKGENHPCSKLKQIQVDEVISLLKKGLSASQVEEKTGVSRGTVLVIRGNKQWKRKIKEKFPDIIPVGEKNAAAKLTWEQVREIRKLHKEGMTQIPLAKMFGVKQATISRIVLNKGWRET